MPLCFTENTTQSFKHRTYNPDISRWRHSCRQRTSSRHGFRPITCSAALRPEGSQLSVSREAESNNSLFPAFDNRNLRCKVATLHFNAIKRTPTQLCTRAICIVFPAANTKPCFIRQAFPPYFTTYFAKPRSFRAKQYVINFGAEVQRF